MEIKLRPGSDAAPLACSRLSDSGEDTKVKGMRKVGEAKKRKGMEREPVIISSTTLFCPLLARLR